MKANTEIAKEMRQECGSEDILLNEPLKNHTSFRIGGEAALFVSPKTAEETAAIVRYLRAEAIPFFVLGNGTNLLVSDRGYKGVIVHIGKAMGEICVQGDCIQAGAGALLSRIAACALENELDGFAFASGIPGTLGGACIMNAGAYGGEMKDVLEEVTVLAKDGTTETLSADAFALGYRTSAFKTRGDLVLAAKIRLRRGIREEIRLQMEDLAQRRREKQPLTVPSAGSTFKRPEGYFAGKLIADAGLKGTRIGDAMVSEKHAGFVVNAGDATAADVLALICRVQQEVQRQFGVLLETEVQFLGDFS